MEYQQELYVLKRQLSAEKASCRFLQEELEIIQKEIKEKENKDGYTIKQLREEIDLNKNSALEWQTKVEHLEEDREEERKKNNATIIELKEQLSHVTINQEKHDLAIHSDVQGLKDQIEILECALEMKKCDCEQLMQEKMLLLKQMEEILKAKDELDITLLTVRQELTSCSEHNSALQEEIVLLKVENNAFKSAPESHASKGNSVFAEVDDNRKALKNNFDKLAEKYNVLKKDLKSKSSEISKLRAEKSALLRKVQEVSSKFESNESNLIDKYKARIMDLETTIEDLKKERECHVSAGDYKAINGIFAAKNKKIETLEEKVEKLSQTSLLQSETIFFLRRDLEIQTAEAAYELSEKMRLQELFDAKTSKDN